tara:strand:+ start:286 stop:687 length:402 start_codon:yes stop_codon:yes gene_type:complete
MITYKITYKLMDDKKSSTAQTEKIKDETIKHYQATHKDLFKFINNLDNEEIAQEFSEYGLSINVVKPLTFEDQEEAFIRYQISWGGPSEEFRKFEDRIEYCYLDWFVGYSLDVSEDETVNQVFDYFEGIGYSL